MGAALSTAVAKGVILPAEANDTIFPRNLSDVHLNHLGISQEDSFLRRKCSLGLEY